MVISILSLILFVLLLIPMIISFKFTKEIFSPIMISFFFLIVTSVPYLLSIANDYNIIHPLVRMRISELEIEMAIAEFGLIFLIGVGGLLLGLGSKFPKSIVKPIPIVLTTESNSRYILASFFTLLVGLIAYLNFINSVGGFSFWFENIQRRASFTTGNGYNVALIGLLEIGVYIFICSFKFKKSTIKYIILLALIITVSFLLSSMGGRKPTLQFIAFCMIVWHFAVTKIRKLPIKMAVLIPIAVVYILLIPILRVDGGLEFYLNNPNELMDEVAESTGGIAHQISYIDHYLLVFDYFSTDNLWYGEIYLDLLYAPIPRAFFPEKPPVDDGVYLRTIAEGKEVEPSTPYYQMFQSSWPPETLGTMYMNFWIVGVFVGMYILGVIYSASYHYMIKSSYNLFSILVYGKILLNFHLSNLRIVQTLTDILFIFIVLSIFFFSYRKKKC